MAFTPTAYATIRTKCFSLLDTALTEGVYYEDPDALDFPRVVVGSVSIAEEMLAAGNIPRIAMSIPIKVSSSVSGLTRDGARTQCWALLAKVQDVIRENPDLDNTAGVDLAMLGDFDINDDGKIIWSVTQDWLIRQIVAKT